MKHCIVVLVDPGCGISSEDGRLLAGRLVEDWCAAGMPASGPMAPHFVHIRMRHGSGLLVAVLENDQGAVIGAFREVSEFDWDLCPFGQWSALERELDGGGTTH